MSHIKEKLPSEYAGNYRDLAYEERKLADEWSNQKNPLVHITLTHYDTGLFARDHTHINAQGRICYAVDEESAQSMIHRIDTYQWRINRSLNRKRAIAEELIRVRRIAIEQEERAIDCNRIMQLPDELVRHIFGYLHKQELVSFYDGIELHSMLEVIPRRFTRRLAHAVSPGSTPNHIADDLYKDRRTRATLYPIILRYFNRIHSLFVPGETLTYSRAMEKLNKYSFRRYRKMWILLHVLYRRFSK